MDNIIEFHKKNSTKKKDRVKVANETDDVKDKNYRNNAIFFDPDIDNNLVFDIVENEQIQLAFTTMLTALRQLSTDAELDIKITNEGVLFSTVNSYDTSPVEDGMQTNAAMSKQAIVGWQSENPGDLAVSIGHAIQSLVVFDDDLF